jgi:biotin carboxylase
MAEVDAALTQLGHIHEVSVEEFIDGEEFTYDTICAGGEIQYFHIGYYRPRPLVARTVEWISPQTLSYRHVDDPWVAGGRAMGEQVLAALGFDTGFTHMEWYRKSDGEVVFGEVAARPPGARTVDLMNFASDVDLFTGWAEAEVHGTFSVPIERRYNCACITKRASGAGAHSRDRGARSGAGPLWRRRHGGGPHSGGGAPTGLEGHAAVGWPRHAAAPRLAGDDGHGRFRG